MSIELSVEDARTALIALRKAIDCEHDWQICHAPKGKVIPGGRGIIKRSESLVKKMAAVRDEIVKQMKK